MTGAVQSGDGWGNSTHLCVQANQVRGATCSSEAHVVGYVTVVVGYLSAPSNQCTFH